MIGPATGAGAYMIAGGSNGGLLILLGMALGLLTALGAFFILTAPLAIIGGIAAFLISMVLSFGGYSKTDQLNFKGAQLLGLVGGFILNVIFGQVLILSLTQFFFIGLIALMLSVVSLLIYEAFFATASLIKFKRSCEEYA